MKLLEFTVYLFYRYHSTGRYNDLPHFTAICSVAALFSLHLMQIIIIFDLPFFFFTRGEPKLIAWLKGLGIAAIPIGILSILVPAKRVRELNYDPEQIRIGWRNVIIYFVISLTLVIVLAVGRYNQN